MKQLTGDRSRALAVAADVNCFSVFALKSMDEIRREIHASDAAAFSPIKEVSFVALAPRGRWCLPMSQRLT